MTLSVITPVYINKPHLAEMFEKLFLESLIRHCPSDAELIVIDDGSPLRRETEECVRRAEKRRPLTYLVNERNEGHTSTCNRGLRLAQGDNILIAHNDVRLTAGCVDSMARLLASVGDVGIVGPVVNNAAGFVPQQVTGLAPLESFSRAELDRVDRFGLAVRSQLSGSWEVRGLIGCCMMLKRELLRTVGYFDEKIGYAGEDIDYAIRAREAGYRLLVDRSSFVFHGGLGGPIKILPNWSSQTMRTRPLSWAVAWTRGVIGLFRKHGRQKLLPPEYPDLAMRNPPITP